MKKTKHFIKCMVFSLAAVLLASTVISVSAVNADAKTNWKKLYLNYITKDSWCQEHADSARLIHINNDNIPEIFIEGDYAASGNILLTIYKGKVYKEVLGGDDGLYYVPKKGHVYIHGGKMDQYFDGVGKLIKGKLKISWVGEFGAEDNSNLKLDKNGNPVYEYYWKGKKVSQKTYETSLKKAKGNYKYKDAYSYKKMISMKELKKKLK